MELIKQKQVEGLPAALDERVLTTDRRLSDPREPTAHNHDERYYTEPETDALLSGKVNSNDPRLSDARTPLAHTHSASQITDFATAVGALISAYDTQLKDGVAEAGNTLQKLYNLILGQFSEISVTTLAARDALNIVRLPTNVFVQDDGDGRWALYRATSTGQPASYVKLSDPDLMGAVLSASQIKASYESNPDTNAFTNALLAKLQGLVNYTDAQAAQAAKPYTDEQIAAVNTSLANKTNNATTAALSGRVTTLEQVLQASELVADKQADWAGLTPRAALLKLINEGSGGGGTPTPQPETLAITDVFAS